MKIIILIRFLIKSHEDKKEMAHFHSAERGKYLHSVLQLVKLSFNNEGKINISN